jgi:hypothetical protein
MCGGVQMAKRCKSNQVMIRGRCYTDNKKKYGIIMATPTVEREGHVPERIVLRSMGKDILGNEQYVTHHQGWLVDRNKVRSPNFFWGHYFIDKKSAVEDFNERARNL